MPDITVGHGSTGSGFRWAVHSREGNLILVLGSMSVAFTGKAREEFAEAVARAVTPGQRVKHGPGCRCTPCKAAYPLAPPPPGDPAVSAYLARRATCRRCGEPGLVPSPAVLGLWLSDRQGTGRGLCPDGETMHQAGNITEGNGSDDRRL